MKAETLPMNPAAGHGDFNAFKFAFVMPVRRGAVLTPCRPIDLVPVIRSRQRPGARARRGAQGGAFYARIVFTKPKPEEPDDAGERQWAAKAKRARKKWMDENPF
jgi:hypothetical protein